jgi:predicted ester cyclase
LKITETNRSIAEQFHEAFNRGDLDAAASCFAEDCQNHGRKVGRAGVRTVLGEIKTNFPDAKLTTLKSVAEGEWVAVRCTYSGTHRGSSRFPVDGGMLVGVQPTVEPSRFSTSTCTGCSMARSLSTLRTGTMSE